MNRNDNPDRMSFSDPPPERLGIRTEGDGNHTPEQPGEVVRWADRAQYHSAQMPAENRAPGGGALPTVRLLNATPDPLGSLAAIVGIYKGEVYSSLNAVDDDERRAALNAMQETVLDGPLEAINFHFLVQGVTRAFTHQAVRNRFSFFAQESMRFAVVDDESWIDRSAYPPSLAAEPEQAGIGPPDEDDEEADFYLYGYSSPEAEDYALRRDAWDDAILTVEAAYRRLVAAGVPAEEARGLMPHSITTRYHWVVSLRTLLSEAGKRLCTQAQFEWRLVMAEVVKALREYGGQVEVASVPWPGAGGEQWAVNQGWQFEAMADMLQPVCYKEGKCGFMAKFDRGCTIRERVNDNAALGRPSSEWHTDSAPVGNPGHIYDSNGRRIAKAIHPKEWLADPGAARVAPGRN